MEHVQRDERHDDAGREGVLVLVGVGEEGDPDEDAPEEHQGCPILHNVHGDRAQIAARPTTDVLPVELVLDELTDSADEREQLDRACHEEELVGPPDVVHIQRRDLVRVHALHDVVSERVAEDHRPVDHVHGEHERHHAFVVEVVVHLEEGAVVVEPDPEERCPEPHEVCQVVHGNDEPAPPPHFIGEVAALLEALAHHGDEPDNQEGGDKHHNPQEELEEEIAKYVFVQLIAT
mmetsp:Transcript_78580/g.243783  ORF Transcript_78580/g.243783 Transcript_78580/m.243783 type:complete len:234 (-) Transcript_78580:1529-2230(-)